MKDKDPRLAPVYITGNLEVRRCHVCLQSMEDYGGGASPLKPYNHHDFLSDGERALKRWQHIGPCSKVEKLAATLRGGGFMLEELGLRNNKKHLEVYKELSKRYYEAEKEWRQWFIKNFGEEKLAQLEETK